MAVIDPRLQNRNVSARKPSVKTLDDVLNESGVFSPQAGAPAVQLPDLSRPPARPKQGDPGGWKGLVADVLNFAPIKYGIMKPLELLQVPGHMLIGAMDEWDDWVDGDPSTKPSWSEWWDKSTDPTYGYGTFIGDAFDNQWLNRTVGFLGDMLLDPLLLVNTGGRLISKSSGAALEVADRAGMELLAARSYERFIAAGDTPIVAGQKAAQIARYGPVRARRLLTVDQASEIGLQRSGLYLFRGKFAKSYRIPLTGVLGDALGASTAATRLALTQRGLGRWFQRVTMRGDETVKAARIALARGEVPAGRVGETLAMISAVDPMRAAKAAAQGYASDAFSKLTKATKLAADDVLAQQLTEVMEDPAAFARATGRLRVAADAVKAFMDDTFQRLIASYKLLDAAAGEEVTKKLGYTPNYFTHILTPEAIEHVIKFPKQMADTLDSLGVRELDPASITYPRRLVAGRKFFGYELTDADLTIARLNKIANDGGFVGNFFETDARKILNAYAKDWADQMGNLAAFKHLQSNGLLKRIEQRLDTSPAVIQQVQREASRAARKFSTDLLAFGRTGERLTKALADLKKVADNNFGKASASVTKEVAARNLSVQAASDALDAAIAEHSKSLIALREATDVLFGMQARESAVRAEMQQRITAATIAWEEAFDQLRSFRELNLDTLAGSYNSVAERLTAMEAAVKRADTAAKSARTMTNKAARRLEWLERNYAKIINGEDVGKVPDGLGDVLEYVRALRDGVPFSESARSGDFVSIPQGEWGAAVASMHQRADEITRLDRARAEIAEKMASSAGKEKQSLEKQLKNVDAKLNTLRNEPGAAESLFVNELFGPGVSQAQMGKSFDAAAKSFDEQTLLAGGGAAWRDAAAMVAHSLRFYGSFERMPEWLRTELVAAKDVVVRMRELHAFEDVVATASKRDPMQLEMSVRKFTELNETLRTQLDEVIRLEERRSRLLDLYQSGYADTKKARFQRAERLRRLQERQRALVLQRDSAGVLGVPLTPREVQKLTDDLDLVEKQINRLRLDVLDDNLGNDRAAVLTEIENLDRRIRELSEREVSLPPTPQVASQQAMMERLGGSLADADKMPEWALVDSDLLERTLTVGEIMRWAVLDYVDNNKSRAWYDLGERTARAAEARRAALGIGDDAEADARLAAQLRIIAESKEALSYSAQTTVPATYGGTRGLLATSTLSTEAKAMREAQKVSGAVARDAAERAGRSGRRAKTVGQVTVKTQGALSEKSWGAKARKIVDAQGNEQVIWESQQSFEALVPVLGRTAVEERQELMTAFHAFADRERIARQFDYASKLFEDVGIDLAPDGQVFRDIASAHYDRQLQGWASRKVHDAKRLAAVQELVNRLDAELLKKGAGGAASGQDYERAAMALAREIGMSQGGSTGDPVFALASRYRAAKQNASRRSMSDAERAAAKAELDAAKDAVRRWFAAKRPDLPRFKFELAEDALKEFESPVRDLRSWQQYKKSVLNHHTFLADHSQRTVSRLRRDSFDFKGVQYKALEQRIASLESRIKLLDEAESLARSRGADLPSEIKWIAKRSKVRATKLRMDSEIVSSEFDAARNIRQSFKFVDAERERTKYELLRALAGRQWDRITDEEWSSIGFRPVDQWDPEWSRVNAEMFDSASEGGSKTLYVLDPQSGRHIPVGDSSSLQPNTEVFERVASQRVESVFDPQEGSQRLARLRRDFGKVDGEYRKALSARDLLLAQETRTAAQERRLLKVQDQIDVLARDRRRVGNELNSLSNQLRANPEGIQRTVEGETFVSLYKTPARERVTADDSLSFTAAEQDALYEFPIMSPREIRAKRKALEQEERSLVAAIEAEQAFDSWEFRDWPQAWFDVGRERLLEVRRLLAASDEQTVMSARRKLDSLVANFESQDPNFMQSQQWRAMSAMEPDERHIAPAFLRSRREQVLDNAWSSSPQGQLLREYEERLAGGTRPPREIPDIPPTADELRELLNAARVRIAVTGGEEKDEIVAAFRSEMRAALRKADLDFLDSDLSFEKMSSGAVADSVASTRTKVADELASVQAELASAQVKDRRMGDVAAEWSDRTAAAGAEQEATRLSEKVLRFQVAIREAERDRLAKRADDLAAELDKTERVVSDRQAKVDFGSKKQKKAVDKLEVEADKRATAVQKATARFYQAIAISPAERAARDRAAEAKRNLDLVEDILRGADAPTAIDRTTVWKDGKILVEENGQVKPFTVKAVRDQIKKGEDAQRLLDSGANLSGERIADLEEVVARGERFRKAFANAQFSDAEMSRFSSIAQQLRDNPALYAELASFAPKEAKALEAVVTSYLNAEVAMLTSRSAAEAAEQVLMNPSALQSYVRQLEEGFSTLEEWGLPGLQANPYVREFFDNFRRLEEAPIAQMMEKFFGWYTKRFKAYALATPGFHIRNALDNTFRVFSAGADVKNMWSGARLYEQWVSARRNGTVDAWLLNLGAQRETFDTALRIYYAAGSGQQGAAIGDILGAFKRSKIDNNFYLRANARLGERVEGSARFMLAFDSAAKGMDFQQGTNRVRRYLFDYSAEGRSTLDRSLAQIIPFWTYMSKNFPFQIVNRWTNPQAYIQLNKILSAASGGPAYELTEYMNQTGGVNMGGGDVLMLDVGQNRIAEQLNMLKDPVRLLKDVNPALRLPVELAGNRRYYNNRPFSNQPSEIPAGPLSGAVAALLDVLGMTDSAGPKRASYQPEEGTTVIPSKVAYALTGSLPPVAQLERLFPNTEQGKQNQMNAILAYLGIPYRNLTPEQIAENTKRNQANK